MRLPQKMLTSTPLLLLLILFASCRPSPKTGPPPTSFNNPPIYPGALNVHTDQTAVEFGPKIAFQVRDEPDKVLDYYTTLLLKEGWTPDDLTDQPPNQISFHYAAIDCPEYGFGIEAKKQPQGQTDVDLRPQSITCID